MIPLITSIPPSIRRQSTDGKEIGEEYALACIRSWREQGFAPVSINAESEILASVIDAEQIPVIKVKRDASASFGKPLVYLGDLVAAAHSLTDGPVVLSNSDILLDIPKPTKHAIINLEPGQCLVSRRHDIHDLDSRSGAEYLHGYDFFAFHTRDLSGFSNDDFVFGLPWWDHYLPIYLYFRGVKSLPLGTPFVFHLIHEERWAFDNWYTLGHRFVEVVSAESAITRSADAAVEDYACRLASHLADQNSRLSRFFHRLRLKKLTHDSDMLDRVAALNVQWLDGKRLSG